MPDTVTATILSACAKGATELVFKALGTLAKQVGGDIKVIKNDKKSNLEAHFNSTFERCTKIKTLLNRAEPIPLTDIYVNTKFRVDSGKFIDDYDLIEDLPKKKRLVIAGTGGGGKTIFMKYLWLAMFSTASEKIPVFMELRRMNEITSDDLVTYIYKSIIGTSAVISQEMFTAAARKGSIIFILDGFDEIAKEKKETIASQIVNLGYDNPEAIIIVSGRPDSRFDSWQNFTTLQVSPMSKQQVLTLIDKFTYEKTTKKNFAKRVRTDLYDKHTTFLSNPLLATMMMLTFDQFAEIPEKIFVFYEQAFDTLFSKHDATKEGFKRQHRTGLSIDTFKQCLSYLCLFSYHSEKYEFTHSELIDFTKRAFKVNSLDIKDEDFIFDMREAICLIQEEGLLYVFTHRSFQEYFSALCLSVMISERFAEILQKIYLRNNDNVVRMLFEMNQGKVEKFFLLPKIRDLLAQTEYLRINKDFANTAAFLSLEAAVSHVYTKKGEPLQSILEYVADNDKFVFLLLLRRLYPTELYPSEADRRRFQEMDAEFASKNPIKPRPRKTTPVGPTIYVSGEKSEHLPPGLNCFYKPSEMLKATGFGEYWSCFWDRLNLLENRIDARLQNTEKSIEAILDL